MRTRHRLPVKTRLVIAHALLQQLALLDRFALLRCPRAELVTARADCKVRVRLFLGYSLREAFDADLPLERGPVEHRRRVRVLFQFPAFAAEVTGEEHEPAGIDFAKEHHPCRRT